MKRIAVLTAMLAFQLGGCVNVGDLPTLTLTPEQAVYRLGSGDMLKITVFGEERLTGTYAVGGDGAVSLPLIGPVPAQGRTVDELRGAITTILADGFLQDPSVSVEVTNFRPYYLLGEVNKPGEYPFVEGMTVFGAVAKAEGFTYRADDRRVFIRHKNLTTERQYRLEGGTPVQPGDTIRIEERAF